MSETLASAFRDVLATEGLRWLVLGVTLAGLVRGFSGFGTAMIYMPIAGSVLSPIWALTTMVVFDPIGPLPIIPRAVRDGHPRDVLRLGLGALLAVPLGVWALTRLDPGVFRWMISLIAIGLVVILMVGWRYRGALTRKMTYGVGALGGFLAGSTGLPGPPVILLYMASPLSPTAIRANTMLFLFLVDFILLAAFWGEGLLNLTPVLIGFLLVPPYMLGNVVGAFIFNPDRERVYRIVAYLVIGTSAIMGLPVLD